MSEKPVAVVDLGSHSALLLIAKKEKGTIKVLFEDFKVTRLGQGLNQQRTLSPESQTRALEVLKQFQNQANEFDCARMEVIGTEALRKAQNARSFIQRVESELGLTLRVLSTNEEAKLSYLGAVSAFEKFDKQQFTVIDVGGRSTEIIMGNGRQIKAQASIPLGAARLAEEMNFKITLCSSDRMGLMQIVKVELEKITFWNEIDITRVLVGSGGTITTLAAIQHKMKQYDSQLISQTTLDRQQIWRLFYLINALNLAERLQIPGLESGREDVLIYGVIIYLTIMELRRLPWIRVSARGLRYGVALEILNNQSITTM